MNLEELAEATFVEREVTDDNLRSELRAKMRLTAAQLAGDNPSTAVRMCAAAAVFAWADHWILNMQAGVLASERMIQHQLAAATPPSRDT